MAGYFKATVSEGSFGPHDIYRGELGADGLPIYHIVENDEYINPPTGAYHVKCTGFSRPFEREKLAEYVKPGQNKMQTVSHLELEIQDGPGKGVRFLMAWQNMVISFNKQNPSNIGRIIMAGKFNDAEPPRGTEFYFDDVIGCEFMAYGVESPEKFTDGPNAGKPKKFNISRDTITAVKAGAQDASAANPFARTSAA